MQYEGDTYIQNTDERFFNLSCVNRCLTYFMMFLCAASNAKLISFRILNFFLQNYNGIQSQGSTLSLGYQIQFATTTVAPKLVSVAFNGATICSSGNVATTTTTAAPKTTTAAKTTTTTVSGSKY